MVKESTPLILKEKINGVTLTVTPNLSDSYPAAYRTLTRDEHKKGKEIWKC